MSQTLCCLNSSFPGPWPTVLASMVGNPSHNLHISTGQKSSNLYFFPLWKEHVTNVVLELPSCVFITKNVYMNVGILGLVSLLLWLGE